MSGAAARTGIFKEKKSYNIYKVGMLGVCKNIQTCEVFGELWYKCSVQPCKVEYMGNVGNIYLISKQCVRNVKEIGNSN